MTTLAKAHGALHRFSTRNAAVGTVCLVYSATPAAPSVMMQMERSDGSTWWTLAQHRIHEVSFVLVWIHSLDDVYETAYMEAKLRGVPLHVF